MNWRIQFIGMQARRSNLPKKCLNRLSSGSADWLAVSIKCMAGDRWSLYRKRAPLPVLYRYSTGRGQASTGRGHKWLLDEREGFLSTSSPSTGTLPVLYRKRGCSTGALPVEANRSTGTSAGWASSSGGSAGWPLKASFGPKLIFQHSKLGPNLLIKSIKHFLNRLKRLKGVWLGFL